MTQGWGPLAGVAAVLLLITGSTWPRHNTHSVATTAKALVDPATAIYDSFNPGTASLQQVQVVFRHGARTPLNQVYGFRGASWTHCRNHYQGVEVELFDENGGAQPPPILDNNTPPLPGGCTEGTLTEAGYGMAVDLGTQLRNRYVEGSGPTAGFLPDLTSAAAAVAAVADPRRAGSPQAAGGWEAAVVTLRTTPIRRTVATLRGVLTGLWPRLAEATARQQQLQRKVLQQQQQPTALPVGASVESLEIMYGNNRTCPRLAPLHEAMQRDLEAADARNAELPRLNRLVAEALGLDPRATIVWPKLYDTLVAMIADGAPLPPGATRDVLDIIWAQAERHEAGVIGPGTDLCNSLGPGTDHGRDQDADSSSARRRRCHEVLRLGIGVLVRRLLDNMEHRVAAEEVAYSSSKRRVATAAASAAAAAPPSKLYLFSGHDSSLMPLLAVLGQPARAWPPFAGSLIFELWRAGPADRAAGGRRMAASGRRREMASGVDAVAGGLDAEFWVRILYNGSPLVVPGVSNTGGWAPLGVLRQRVLLPYAIGLAEHTAQCAREDISDLAGVQAPSPARGSNRGQSVSQGLDQGGVGVRRSLGDRGAWAAVGDLAARHAML